MPGACSTNMGKWNGSTLNWKKTSVWFFILLNILLVGYIWLPIPFPEQKVGDLIGRWVRLTDVETDFILFDEFEFDPSGRAVIDGTGIDESFDNTVYTYQVDENGILTLGGARLGGSWQVVWIDSNHIRLISTHDKAFWGEFERRRTPNWLVVCLCLICELVFVLRPVQKKSDQQNAKQPQSFWKNITLPYFLFDFLAVFLGLMAGRYLWYSDELVHIHLPWDLVIKLLLSGLMLAVAVYLQRRLSFRWIGPRSFSHFLFAIGFFVLIGIGCSGLITSLPHFLVFLIIGRY